MLALSPLYAQTNYYSKSAGNLDALATWGVNTDGTGTAPSNFSSASQIFNIRNNAAPAIGVNWTVSGAGSKVIIGDGTNPCVLTIPGVLVFTAPCDISNLGTLKVSSTAVTPYSGSLTVLNGGTYEHARDGGAIPAATWNPSSNCSVTGVIGTIPVSSSFDQTFGNLIWDCPNQSGLLYLESNITIAGNFVVTETGTPYDPSLKSLRISNSNNGFTITVGGNVVIDNNGAFKMNNSNGSCIMNIGGDLNVNNGNFTICTGTANSTVNVNGNVNISGGTLCLKEDNTTFRGILNVKGNFTHSNGTVTHLDGGTGPGVINYTGTSAQTFSRTGGTFLNLINFTVGAGSILDVGTSTITGSTGTFTLSSGAGIITAHALGLSSSGGTGSIQVSGIRTFNSGADYTYNGSTAQITGNAISTVRDLTVNNANGLSLTNDIVVNRSLNLTQGTINTGGNILSLTNGTPASLSYGVTGFIVGIFERRINTTFSDYYFPVGVSRRQMAKFNFSNLSNGSLRVSFQETDPSGSGLPLYDSDGQSIQNEFNNGFWTTLAQNSFSSNNYSVTLDAVGFDSPYNINSSTRIIKRTGNGDWIINGTPGTVSGTILERLACNGISNFPGSQFGAGTGNCFSISGQPGSVTRCIGENASFSVSVTGGLGAKTYQWYKGSIKLSDLGNVSGSNSGTLSISNIAASDEASYYCLVTDNCSSVASQTAVLTISRPAAALGYRYQKSIIIDHTKVGGGTDLFNFPVLINISAMPELRNVPVGHVENAAGYDIIFTDENFNKLDHQVENYSSAGGDLIAWVRIPVLSSSSNTTIRMLYGNPLVTVNPSTTSAWSSDYGGVWHLQDLTDATDGGNNGTNIGSAGVAGIIGQGREFNNAGSISIPQSIRFEPPNNLTVSLWFRRNGAQLSWAHPLWYGRDDVSPWGPYGFEFKNDEDNNIDLHVGNGLVSSDINTGKVITDNTWFLLTGTYDGSSVKLYLNNSLVNSDPLTGPIGQYSAIGLTLGNRNSGGEGFRGIIDEVTISNSTRSLGWIQTQYSNQGSPSTFYGIGVETDCSVFSFKDLCSGSPIQYNVPNTAGHSYSWTVIGGAPSATTGNNITVSWNPAGPYSIQLSESAGSCIGSSISYSIVVTPAPVSQSIIRLPDVSDVCVTGAVSATFSGGSGGINPVNVYESSTDAGFSWQPYTSGSDISSTIAESNRLQIRTSRTSTGTGCSTSAYNTATWNTTTQPEAQAITKFPDVTDVCVTGTVSATFSGGSGGASPVDVYESSVDGGATWLAYTSGSSLSSGIAGLNRIKVRTSRTSVGAGCTASSYNSVSWSTVSQPEAQTIIPLPNVSDVCVTGAVSATFSGGSGGLSSTNEYGYSIDGGSTWLAYTPGSPISSATAGANRLQIRTRRISTGTGCTNSSYNYFTWNVLTQPDITTQPLGATICYNSTHSMSVVVNGGTLLTYQWQVSPNGSDTWTNVGTNSPDYTTPALTSNRYYKVIISSTGTGCTTPNESDVAGVLIETVAPTITCPGVLTQNVDAGVCNASVAVPNATTGDNCGVTSLTWVMTGATAATSAATGINQIGTYTFNTGLTNVTYTVKDAAGNAASCSFTVTISDNILPTISCPSAIAQNDDAGVCNASVAVPNATTGDNCGVTSLTWVMTGATAATSAATGINQIGTYTFNTGLTNVTYTVKDAAGNAASCSFTVTISDNILPTISCPGVITQNVDAGVCNASVAVPNATTGDNCGVTSLTWVMTGATAATSAATGINQIGTYTFNTGLTNVTYTVKDAAGNAASCSFTVTISDNILPTISCPGVITQNVDAGVCNASVAVPNATTGDNCGVTSLTWAMTGATAATSAATGINQIGTYTFNTGLTNVTYTVKDAAGNAASCSFTVTISDNILPTISCPSAIAQNDDAGVCNASVAVPNATTGDNCGVTSLTWVMTGATAATSAATGINQIGTYTFNTGLTNVTYTVKDAAGNAASCSFTVTISDNILPTISCPGVITQNVDAGVCNASVAVPNATTGDNCGVTSLTWAMTGATAATSATTGINQIGTYTFNTGLTNVTYTVKDAAGNAASCSFTVTISDNILPTISCPGVITQNVDAGVCNASVAVPNATTGDNCGVTSLTWAMTGATAATSATTGINQIGTYTFNTGLTNVTYTVKDAAGNAASCSFTVTISDNILPTISCPSAIAQNDDAGVCNASVAVPNATTGDNCGVTSLTWAMTGATAATSAATGINQIGTYTFNTGLTNVTYTVKDAAGNAASCSFTVTISDNILPTISCPVDILTTTSVDGTGNCTTTAVLGVPTTSDNCGVVSVIAQIGGVTINPATYAFQVGLTTVTWIAADGSGNTASCSQTVTVTDNEIPSISCPANIAHNADAGSCTYLVSTGVPVTNDNCGVSTVVGTRSDSQVLTNPYPFGVTTIHWVVTDVNGNTNSCDQTVTITDTEIPSITCPPDITHTADAGMCSYTVSVGVPVTDDNCGVQTVVGTRSDSQLLTDPYPVGVVTIYWVVTDVHGNTNNCDQKITVTDNEVPVIACPANIIINCEDDHTPVGTGTATATDICTPAANITIGFTDVSTYSSDASNVLHYNYTINRKWKATDVAGNSEECTQIITVHDITKPVITCPTDVTIDCEDDNTPVGTGTATATDICTPAANITIGSTDVSTYSSDASNVLHYNYTINRKWKATDVAGNFEECTQIITVHDITKPVITCPADVTIDCEDDNTPVGTGTATATDICTPAANITIGSTDVSTYSSDASNVLHYNYTINRKWKATDVAGNFEECTQIITVHDITKPVITCPADVTIDCEDDNTPVGTGTATATDICTPAANITIGSTDVSTYSSDASNVLHYNYTINRKWKATDVAGNFEECTQIITVHDITKPVITCPADVTIDCENINTPVGTGTATATDICTPAPNIAIGYTDVSTYSSDASNVLHYNYTINRKWKATDVVGNFEECTQIITVHDITKPVITCPADVTIDCEDINTPVGTGTATATDICTPAANITIGFTDVSTYSSDVSNVLHYNYTINRKWKATDVAGNFEECTQIITVHDITKPVITCPADVTSIVKMTILLLERAQQQQQISVHLQPI